MDKKLTFKMKVLRFTKKYKKRTTPHTLIATAILLFLLILIPAMDQVLVQGKPEVVTQTGTFTASFTGDLNFNDYYEKYINDNGTTKITQDVIRYLETSDYVTGNVIGTFTETEAKLLADSHFSVVDVYDETAAETTILEKNDLPYVGTRSIGEDNVVYQQINDVTVATLGTSEARFVDDLKWIKEAKLNADIVVVHINWYEKYTTKVSDSQRSIAKALSDAGADFIVGHNTRVLQPIEIYQDTVIMYSLGNFLHGEVYASTQDSAIIQYTTDANFSSITMSIIPLSLTYGRPHPAVNLTEVLNRHNIFDVLTRELPDTITTTETNGVLSFTLH
ncbi:CapA family protein [Acetobacterium sp. UBA5834]|jgi:poly-gamma-glutamate synthesis protein (capsule biosynthesis protein)|uniref:CapA family protein n=1 Tax=Acetobacterium sp. UBA5834 TaxID=1945907 RepID=UPI00257E29A8|nr:CapA family protein [Acetobacterium sp. UBA5834]